MVVSNFRSVAGALVVSIGVLTSLATTWAKTSAAFPSWAREAVWYQILPDRFFNGDASNDPSWSDMQGSEGMEQLADADGSAWKVHPWTSDWYRRQPYEKGVSGKGFWNALKRRRYGGDIEGIRLKLDYLQELGVTAIYLNPVFMAPSHHKYDTASHIHVDPSLGPSPAQDLDIIAAEDPADPKTWRWTTADRAVLALIEEVHRRGMRIIFDGVFNHVGRNHWAFRDVLMRQEKSPFSDWFSVISWRDASRGVEFKYHGWYGHSSLPELREDEQGLVAGPKSHIFEITKRWMDPDGDGDPSDGIDGWRLDVAFCLGHPFWKEWRRLVKSINPEAYLTAEVIDSPKVLKDYLSGDEFDAVMNYNFAFYAAAWLLDQSISAAELGKRLTNLLDSFPPEVSAMQQNLFGSHDTARLASQVVNRRTHPYSDWGGYFTFSQAAGGKFDTRKPNHSERALQKLFVVLQTTWPGAPMIYYGDEAGMWGANDPCARKPMVWPEFDYEDEVVLPSGEQRRKPDRVAFDRVVFEHYKRLLRLRSREAPLRLGGVSLLAFPEHDGVFGFQRTANGRRVSVVINRGKEKVSLRVPADSGVFYKDALKDSSPPLVADRAGFIHLAVSPLGAIVLCPDHAQ